MNRWRQPTSSLCPTGPRFAASAWKSRGGPSVGDGTAVDTDAVPDASRISPPVLLPGFPNPVRLSLTIDLYDHNGCVATEGIRSSLHAILTKDAGGFRRVRLYPGDRLNRD